jgi:nucleoid-associated protein YgaU
MGRDAKIGLLVGLSFILLFVIILAKRNAEVEPFDGQQMTPEVVAAQSRQPGDAASDNPLVDPPPVAQAPPIMPSPTEPAAADVRVPEPATVIDVGLPSVIVTGPQVPPTRLPGEDVLDRMVPGHRADAGRLMPPLEMAPARLVSADNPMSRGEWTLQIGGNGTDRTARSRTPDTASATHTTPLSRRRIPSTPAQPRPNTYLVKEGDSLYTIAVRTMGKGYYWKRIQKANPALIEDPNLLRPGMKLKIPSSPTPTDATRRVVRPSTSRQILPGTTRVADTANSSVQVHTATRSPLTLRTSRTLTATTTLARTYKVQPGDSLTKIADSVLKSTKRWREIYDLNRDKLSSPNHVTVGMVLKMPAPHRTRDVAAAPRTTY